MTIEQIIAQLFPPHPAVPQPTQDEIRAALQHGGEAMISRMCEVRSKDIANIEQFPFEHPFRIEPLWSDADRLLAETRVLVLFGGNRSSKTTYCVDYAVRFAVDKPESKILLLHSTDKRSKTVHQDAVFKRMPQEWRAIARSTSRRKNTKLSYKEGDGFTDGLAIFPNRSRIEFGFYTADVSQYEGDEYDLIIADENLPLSWLKTLIVRLYTRRGKLLWPFTPVDGITPAVAHVTRGARTIKSQRAPLLPATHRASEEQDWPHGHMPLVQKNNSIPGAPEVTIQYFWSEYNPFANYADMARDFATAPVVDIERRLYGYCRDSIGVVFAKFGTKHILTDAWQMPKTATGIMAIDPANRRNPFMLWGCVDEAATIYITHEWPDRPTYGPWAIPTEDPNKFDGDPGPATISMQWGIEKYCELFKKIEAELPPVQWRWMDPRFAAQAQAMTEAGGTNLRERFIKEGYIFEPAPGKEIQIGETEITERLTLDPLTGQPTLFIHHRCENLIDALRNYTGRDGEKGAQKDPIDVLRYITTGNPCHIPAGQGDTGGGGW